MLCLFAHTDPCAGTRRGEGSPATRTPLRSARRAAGGASPRGGSAAELEALRGEISSLRQQLEVGPSEPRQPEPPQVMVVSHTPSAPPTPRRGGGGSAAGSGEGGSTARSLRLARAAVQSGSQGPLPPPSPSRPRDPRRGPNGKFLRKVERPPKPQRARHNFKEKALPFLLRLNTFNDPKHNFPRQATDVTRVNVAAV